jgi:hypothetical protein
MNQKVIRCVIFGLASTLAIVVGVVIWYAVQERSIAPQRHFAAVMKGAGAFVGWERAPGAFENGKCTVLSFDGVAKSRHVNDELLSGISVLEDLERLDLSDCGVTDESVRDIATLKKLRWVSLRGTKVSKMPPQQNSWVKFGSGRAARL